MKNIIQNLPRIIIIFFKQPLLSKFFPPFFFITLALLLTAPTSLRANDIVLKAQPLDDIFENFDPQVEASGSPLVGLLSLPTNGNFEVGNVYTRLPNDTETRICLRIRSKSGSYSGHRPFEKIGRNESGILQLEYPSGRLNTLNELMEDGDLAILIVVGDCDVREGINRNLIAHLSEDLNGQSIVALINSRGSDQVWVSLKAGHVDINYIDRRSDDEDIVCQEVIGRRTAFDFSCKIDLPSRANSIKNFTLVIKRARRGHYGRAFNAYLDY